MADKEQLFIYEDEYTGKRYLFDGTKLVEMPEQNNNSKPPSSNFFSGSQSPNCFLFSPKPEITPNPISLNPKGANMSMCSNLTDGTKQLSLFLSEMNDESKEKINLINFLSIPRVMNLITKKKERQASKPISFKLDNHLIEIDPSLLVAFLGAFS